MTNDIIQAFELIGAGVFGGLSALFWIAAGISNHYGETTDSGFTRFIAFVLLLMMLGLLTLVVRG